MIASAGLLQIVVRVVHDAKLGGRVERDGEVGPVLVPGSDHAPGADEVEGEDVTRGDGGLVAHAVVPFAHPPPLGQELTKSGHKVLECDVHWKVTLGWPFPLLFPRPLFQEAVAGVVTEAQGTTELLLRWAWALDLICACDAAKLGDGRVRVPSGLQIPFRIGTAGAQRLARGGGGGGARCGGGGGGDGRVRGGGGGDRRVRGRGGDGGEGRLTAPPHYRFRRDRRFGAREGVPEAIDVDGLLTWYGVISII